MHKRTMLNNLRFPTKLAVPLFFTVMLIATGACHPEEPYVVVDGKRYTESDLKDNEEMTARYRSVRQKYEADIAGMLEDLAIRQMLDLEAKSRGKKRDEYIQSLMNDTAAPTDPEIQEMYNELKKGGQLTAPLSQERPRIASYLMRQRRQEVVGTEISRLKKKYGFTIPIDRQEVTTGDAPFRGGKNAKVTIVEFSDFECPYCKRAQDTTRQLRDKYGDKIKFVFKDFPLSFHPHSMHAHITAACVNKLKPESFWPFFDSIFASTPASLEPVKLLALAVSLGVDKKELESCQKDPAIAKKVQDNQAEGEKLGVTGTPAFFVNGRSLNGAVPLSDFEAIIRDEL